MKFKRKIFILLICSIFLTGCWDKIEIDAKGLTSIIGIDVGQDISKSDELKKMKPGASYSSMDFKKIHVTYGFPDVSKLVANKGGSSEDVYIETDAYSMEDSLTKAATKSSRVLSLSHAKLLVFSRELFEYPEVVKEVIDYLQREPTINRMMYVVLAEGKASDYMKYKPMMEKNLEKYIMGLINNTSNNDAILPVTLNDLLRLLSENGNAIVPSLTYDKDKKELSLSGVDVIKDYKLKGYITSSQTSTIEMLRGRIIQCKKVIYRQGHPINITLNGVKRKIRFTGDENKVSFHVDLDVEAQLRGNSVGNIVFNEDDIKSIEESFNNAIKEECNNVIAITQRDLMVDPIGFRENLIKYHPKVWKKNKLKWDDVYKNAQITIDVQTSIRRIGVVK